METIHVLRNLNLPDTQTLSLPDTERYESRVWRYHAGHSVLTVRVYARDGGADPVCQFTFEDVAFIHGALSWRGAGFTVLPLSSRAYLKWHVQNGLVLPQKHRIVRAVGNTDFEMVAAKVSIMG